MCSVDWRRLEAEGGSDVSMLRATAWQVQGWMDVRMVKSCRHQRGRVGMFVVLHHINSAVDAKDPQRNLA